MTGPTRIAPTVRVDQSYPRERANFHNARSATVRCRNATDHVNRCEWRGGICRFTWDRLA